MRPRGLPRAVAISLILLAYGCGPGANPSRGTAIPESTATPSLCAPGTRQVEIHDGAEVRSFRLHVPRARGSGTPIAAVLGFHGNAGFADQFETYSGLSALADEQGFIAAYPQGAGDPPTWDTWQGSKDVAWAGRVIDWLLAECGVDPQRVYAVGHSLGGGMANRLACDLADRVAAVGTVSGAYMYAEECAPARPIAILAMHGTDDPIIAYNGIPNGIRETYFTIGVPVPQWASLWARRDGCAPEPRAVFDEPPVSGQVWQGCAGEVEVRLYTIVGGGHGWPVATPAFDPAGILWQFFQAHTLQRGSDG